jgi:bleomycin hydrolase
MYNKLSDIKNYEKAITKYDNTMKNIITNDNFGKVSLNNRVLQKSHYFFNHKLDKKELSPVDQMNSGRCWIFAFTNMIQRHMLNKYKIEKFNISHVYISFWDKFEKCHTFLKRIEETKNLPLKHRIIFNLLKKPIDDGGQWSMIVNIVNKYGIIPKSSMKETYNSKNTEYINYILNLKLRLYAHKLRNSKIKKNTIYKMMKSIYKLLIYFFGCPPKKINWSYILLNKKKSNKTKSNKTKSNKTKSNKTKSNKTKSNKTKSNKNMEGDKQQKKNKRFYLYDISPLDFFNTYVDFEINNYVLLMNAPNREFLKKYRIKYNTNMFNEGIETEYVNVPINMFKEYTINSIKNKEPVWFSCDFGQFNNRSNSLLYDNIYRYEDILNTSLFLDKRQALTYKQVDINHAMLLIGYHKQKRKITKWLVENSHGKQGSNEKGEYYMNDNWFDKYVFEIVIHTKYLDDKVKKILKTKPKMLPMWDPFGDVL